MIHKFGRVCESGCAVHRHHFNTCSANFTFGFVSKQPLAQRRPRNAETTTHCSRIWSLAIGRGPAEPAALLTIPQFDQLNNSSAEAVGLWATQSVVHQVHGLAHSLKRCL